MWKTQENYQDKGQNGMSMSSLKSKPCKNCASVNHTTMMCYSQAKKRLVAKKAMNRVGKRTKAWINARRKWVKENPPNHEGYWKCYLGVAPDCLRWVDTSTLTVDHVVSRGDAPGRLTDQSNLRPACGPCNTLKGSSELEELRV